MMEQEPVGLQEKILEHIITINHELGGLQSDMRWVKWLVCLIMAGVVGLVLKAWVL